MYNKVSPLDYLKAAKYEHLDRFAPAVSQRMLQDSLHGDRWDKLIISDVVDRKYHGYMQKVWSLVALNILFQSAGKDYNLKQKHSILNNSYISSKRCR